MRCGGDLFRLYREETNAWVENNYIITADNLFKSNKRYQCTHMQEDQWIFPIGELRNFKGFMVKLRIPWNVKNMTGE